MSETVVNKPVAKSKMSVGELTSIGLMTAILIVMSFTPSWYVYLPVHSWAGLPVFCSS